MVRMKHPAIGALAAATMLLLTSAPQAAELAATKPGVLRVLPELDLSADQRQQIKTILGTARAQWRSETSHYAQNSVALGNPGDPNHAAAVQAAQARAAERVQRWSEVQTQVFAVLTPDQQAKLPQLLAQQRRSKTRHAAAPAAPPAPEAAAPSAP